MAARECELRQGISKVGAAFYSIVEYPAVIIVRRKCQVPINS